MIIIILYYINNCRYCTYFKIIILLVIQWVFLRPVAPISDLGTWIKARIPLPLFHYSRVLHMYIVIKMDHNRDQSNRYQGQIIRTIPLFIYMFITYSLFTFDSLDIAISVPRSPASNCTSSATFLYN
jgi:hypothetical protein